MKILSIGNSFSQDAHRWLHSIAKADNYELDTVNLYIGGCSLETHWFNYVNDIPGYDMEGNNGEFIRKTSISNPRFFNFGGSGGGNELMWLIRLFVLL